MLSSGMPPDTARAITFTWNWRTVAELAAIGILEAAMWTMMESFPRWFVMMTVVSAVLFIASLNATVGWRGFRFVPWGLGAMYIGMLGYAALGNRTPAPARPLNQITLSLDVHGDTLPIRIPIGDVGRIVSLNPTFGRLSEEPLYEVNNTNGDR